MTDSEATLRRHLRRYLEETAPATAKSVVGVCLTGSLTTDFTDEYADVDLTVAVDPESEEEAAAELAKTLLPPGATVQRRRPLEKYSFDWNGEHFDVDVVRMADLRADSWDLEARWEYDNAEVVIDPTGRIADRLAREVPFEAGERAELVERHADDLLFVGQWDVHAACRRASYQTAHRAVSTAFDHELVLLYLRDGEFVPREKWLVPGLDSLGAVDGETRSLVWKTTRVRERNAEDVHRRLVALRSLWDRLATDLREIGLIEDDSLVWEAPPADLCLLE